MLSPPDSESSLRPGRLLGGKYRVERVLGAGGMGVVVAARHVALDTRFAIKLMRREAASDEESVARFLHEARAAGRLKSEHCVHVIDVGTLENGAPYMVMELLVGQDLAELLARSGARCPAEAVDYVLQTCEGIAEAHSRGIVHRDIKPHNLFVTKGVDGMPLVKVLDFGLAKSVRSTKDGRALTQTKAVLGSPAYMSPEQMRASRTVDARTDTWSLGVCLYELLTGRTPFEGATYPEVCSLVLNEPPAPLPSDVPRELSRVIARCLQKDPRRRYADVAELASALEDFASTRGAAARIRAVLDTPRPGPELAGGDPLRDPDAETKTAAAFDTTRRRPRSTTGIATPWPSVLAVSMVVGAALGTVAVTRSAASHAAAATTSLSAPPAPSPLLAPAAPASTTETSVSGAGSSSRAITPAPVASAPEVSPAKPVHHAPRARPAAPAAAPPKSSAPVLVPKTREF
ncbi:MAG TPA: serine/threonine-protein kinase [Polyangiaceae bacterium]|jgi:serine/threonine-protein kinase